ncbi:MAG: hypothetical protein A2122_02835 [Candidatus Liptonbacteria bacterium GWB1_49_6]|uniref:Uncharacterized protein n=1 Tax=Candidatus Liptonbacteria bacterium GWB1_49_6 TaxID=1798644 RepID=A0A1G2C7C0_9BACT|nr:MAG: hypothetical protein A2122_02835 [Candidatus Liptonbacteria bacterium GWB1_49_6]
MTKKNYEGPDVPPQGAGGLNTESKTEEITLRSLLNKLDRAQFSELAKKHKEALDSGNEAVRLAQAGGAKLRTGEDQHGNVTYHGENDEMREARKAESLAREQLRKLFFESLGEIGRILPSDHKEIEGARDEWRNTEYKFMDPKEDEAKNRMLRIKEDAEKKIKELDRVRYEFLRLVDRGELWDFLTNEG